MINKSKIMFVEKDEVAQDDVINLYHKYIYRDPETDRIIKDLWEYYKKAVREHGHGKESKEVLVKIYSFAPKE